MKICSFVPSATEILFALGLGDSIVGVSHECDYPPEALAKPRLLRTTIDQDRQSSREIDDAVRASLAGGMSLYEVDAEALRRAGPDLVLTQELCEVCAVDTSRVSAALRALPTRPDMLSLHAHTLQELMDEIQLIGRRTGRLDNAQRLVGALQERIADVTARLTGILHRPRVFCLEWLEPPMASGHWVPELVELAGGVDVLGRAGAASRYVTWDEVSAAGPEVLVVMPCGFSVERTRRELSLLTAQRWWAELPAVRQGRVHLVNGPAYFNRCGPRLIEGLELLAGLLHPERCAIIPAEAKEA